MFRFANLMFIFVVGVFVIIPFAPSSAAAEPPLQEPGSAIDYRPVTAERLANPDDGDWLMIRRTYDGWGHSPLAQITTDNVSRLRPVWTFGTGETSGHEAPPVVNDGIMFVSTPRNQVIAIDILSGIELWRYRNIRADDASVPHETNRGVALYDDKVYVVGGEAVLVALDARTGEEIWETTFADNASGYYSTLAPLIADGTVMVGLRVESGEYAVSLPGSIPKTARRYGGPSWCRAPGNRVSKPGHRIPTRGKPAARRSG